MVPIDRFWCQLLPRGQGSQQGRASLSPAHVLCLKTHHLGPDMQRSQHCGTSGRRGPGGLAAGPWRWDRRAGSPFTPGPVALAPAMFPLSGPWEGLSAPSPQRTETPETPAVDSFSKCAVAEDVLSQAESLPLTDLICLPLPSP